MARVLFIYPNIGNSLRIPLGVSILSACLKENSHEVYIFDPTFLSCDFGKDYKLMESRGVVKETDFERMVGQIEEKDISEELRNKINSVQPDFVAISLIERNYSMFKRLLSVTKEVMPDIPVLVGGILPSIYPDILLNEPLVDFICIGEGEKLIVDFADNINDKEKLKSLNNLLFRDGDKIVQNELNPLTELKSIPFQDWEGFDERQLLKPFEGKIYRGGSFEFSRGCYKFCTFCVAPQLRGVYSNGDANYHRTKDPKCLVEEIAEKKKKYKLEINAFCDTDFLAGVPVKILKEFCDEYKKKVDLPFMIQASAEAITDERLELITKAGCITISVGVESGSVRMRHEVLKKKASLERIKKSFNLCRKYNLRTTANYMIGLPFETEEDVQSTINFNSELNPPSIAITYFQPFLGTRLYDICIKEGFYKGFDPEVSVYRESPLDMPQLRPEKILDYVDRFTEEFNSWKTDNIGL